MPGGKKLTTVYIGLGGNVGNPEKAIQTAFSELGKKLFSLKISSLYSTVPRDDINQPVFVNAVIQGQTDLSPGSLLKVLQAIEEDSGRIRDKARPKGPRTLDLDLLFFGKRIINLSDLTVPHPRIKERKFVLVPLLELCRDLRDPVSLTLLAEDALRLENQGIYFLSVNEYSENLSWRESK